MIYSTKDLLELKETEYSIRTKVQNGQLFNVCRGFYSTDSNFVLDDSFICKKYPFAVITGISAFSFYDLTDQIPEYFYLATEQHSFPIRDKNIKQSYQDPSFFNVGVTSIKIDDGIINIYDLERILIELVRLKEKYPLDLYYEVLDSFRKIKYKLDFYKVYEYLKHFKNGKNILLKIKEII